MSDNIYMIYKHTSPSGKSYIGQTMNYDERCYYHQRLAGKCIAFESAIRKYGWNNFTHSILYEDLSQEEANTLEERSIKEHKTLFPNGYNLHPGGKNHSPTPITKEKISNSLKGRIKPPRTSEHCTNISISHQNKVRSDIHKLNLSKSNKGKSKPPRTKQHCDNMKKPKITTTCPHCGKTGGGGSMVRWHFQNCKTLKTNDT
ncbi:MAG: hypothetical protein CTY12_01330 [Methylotenera sp.]|nr:MAG: hypothetical protein CTY12_01330 [Methylotenera sp.]